MPKKKRSTARRSGSWSTSRDPGRPPRGYIWRDVEVKLGGKWKIERVAIRKSAIPGPVWRGRLYVPYKHLTPHTKKWYDKKVKDLVRRHPKDTLEEVRKNALAQLVNHTWIRTKIVRGERRFYDMRLHGRRISPRHALLERTQMRFERHVREIMRKRGVSREKAEGIHNSLMKSKGINYIISKYGSP